MRLGCSWATLVYYLAACIAFAWSFAAFLSIMGDPPRERIPAKRAWAHHQMGKLWLGAGISTAGWMLARRYL